MIKNRVAQIIFQTAFLVICFIGIVESFGLFAAKFNSEFYVFFTNLSNYFCFIVMIFIYIDTYKHAVKKEDGYITKYKTLTFLCMISITVTFLVYNILLAKDTSVTAYFTSLGNLIKHLTVPVLFILNWVLYYEHGQVKWYYPLISVILPLIYAAFIFIRAAIVNGCNITVKTLYPYFFLNADKLGVGGVIMWIGILLIFFIALGYIIFLLDHVKEIKDFFKKKM